MTTIFLYNTVIRVSRHTKTLGSSCRSFEKTTNRAAKGDLICNFVIKERKKERMEGRKEGTKDIFASAEL